MSERLAPPISDPSRREAGKPWLGRSLERREDAALLAGAGRFADDAGTKPGTLHAAFLRSPHAHAKLRGVDASAALAMPGVRAVLTGEDVKRWAAPFVVGVKAPMQHWCLAVDKVRYAGEPLAVVVAEDRYLAEDALEHIVVDYDPLPAVADVPSAIAADAPILHEAAGSNVVSDRAFSYGDPDAAFASAPHRVSLKIRYPRNSCTPIECSVVVAEHLAGGEGYDVLANFMGPFSLHAVMALALKMPAVKLRLRLPRDSGGSFGVKQAVFTSVVALCLASRKAGAPVKWVEDRLEHLLAATSATGRMSTIEAAVQSDGRITALAYDQLDDCGGYLRAPEPATFYRMHGCLTGAYDIAHPEGAQSRRAYQQDAGRIGAGLRRSAGIFRAGTAGTAHRYGAEAGPARRVSPQLHPRRSVSIPCRRWSADRLRQLSRGAGLGRGAGRVAGVARAPNAGPR